MDGSRMSEEDEMLGKGGEDDANVLARERGAVAHLVEVMLAIEHAHDPAPFKNQLPSPRRSSNRAERRTLTSQTSRPRSSPSP